MIIIACVENSFGMCFNGRRVSRDKVVTKKILNLTKGEKLYINEFSKDLEARVKRTIIIKKEFCNN